MIDDLLKDLNKIQQKAVLKTDGPILILAGAGSGKTRVLTHKVAYLIKEKQIDPQSILCLTFTNKAGQEMRERIRKLLSSNLEPRTSNLPFAGTFHSFCARILRKEGRNIKIPVNFLIYDENDQLKIIKEAMK
ncbi:UvrD-helicase domain-containing protein, partial [Candidatus Microgenomates bacterium]|nr:UvrD-helicase domain-containing protein [Candidatus Microgenomates bacterium]